MEIAYRRNEAARAMAAVALAVVIAGAGCQGMGHGAPVARAAPPVAVAYRPATVFAIYFDGGCAVDAQVVDPAARNCPVDPNTGSPPARCLRVKGGAVRFEARLLPGGTGAVGDFVLHFDPFDATGIPSTNGYKVLNARPTSPGVTLDKPHTFVVRTQNPPPSCGTVDPQIILD